MRLGSVEWQLRAGLTLERVAKRADMAVETVRRYYQPVDLDGAPERPAVEAPDLLDGDGDA